MVGRLQVLCYTQINLVGARRIFACKSSGLGIVAIKCLACMEPDRFSNYNIKFWLMYGHL